MSEFWDKQEILGEVEKGENRKIRISRCWKGGREALDIREYFRNREGDYLPTKKGVIIPSELKNELTEILTRREG